MRKHAFLIHWQKEGRVLTPVLDAYASCIWPLGPEAKDPVSAQALVAMIGGHDNLPKEVKQFCHSYCAMELRLRYTSDTTTGVYMIDDPEDKHTDQTIQEWLVSATDTEIARYHQRRVSTPTTRYLA